MPAVLQEHHVPDTILELSTFDPPDYADLFVAQTDGAQHASPEAWARAALDGAPPAGRFLAWQVVLGLRLDHHDSREHVAGWKVAERGEHWIRLEASSWFLTAEIVVHVGGPLSVATLIRYDHPVARVIWPPVAIVHRRAMPGLLHHAVETMWR